MKRLTEGTVLLRLMIGTWFAASFLPTLALPAIAGATSANPEATKLHALFEDEWQWTVREYPEFATSVGDPRYNGTLTDLSVPAMNRRKAHQRDVLARIVAIDRASLSGQDALSYDLFRRTVEQNVSLQRFPAGMTPFDGMLMPNERMPTTQMDGIHLDIPRLPRIMPLRTSKDYDDFLSRLAAYPRQVDQVIELMKRGIASGWVPPAVPIRKVLPQIEKQWAGDANKWPAVSSRSRIFPTIQRTPIVPGSRPERAS